MTKSIVVSRDVVFDETQKGRWLETSENGKDESDMIDFGFKSMSDQETSGDKTGIDVKIEESDTTLDHEKHEEEVIELRRSSRMTKMPSYLED